MLVFRKAIEKDIEKVAEIYSDILTCEENGAAVTGWIRGVYPTVKIAEEALARDDLFVAEDDGEIIGSAIINHIQAEDYVGGKWAYDVKKEEVMVLHTLVIFPKFEGKGYGRKFVDFYEQYALENNCIYLRMDTNARNVRARSLYKKLGYSEVGIVDCIFNGIEDVKMVLLEKCLSRER